MQSMGKSLVAEFIGTFALILLGAGAGTLAGAGIAGSLVTVALAHGLTIMIFAYACLCLRRSQRQPDQSCRKLLGFGLGEQWKPSASFPIWWSR